MLHVILEIGNYYIVSAYILDSLKPCFAVFRRNPGRSNVLLGKPTFQAHHVGSRGGWRYCNLR